MAAERTCAIGLAMPLPAISGAGAAARFIHSETRRAGSYLAEAGARKHSQRAGEHGNFIAQNVAEKILRQHDIEPLWILHQLHGSVVHVEVAETDVREVSRNLLDDASPEDAVLQDIALSMEVTWLRRLRAASKATLAMRRISLSR